MASSDVHGRREIAHLHRVNRDVILIQSDKCIHIGLTNAHVYAGRFEHVMDLLYELNALVNYLNCLFISILQSGFRILQKKLTIHFNLIFYL